MILRLITAPTPRAPSCASTVMYPTAKLIGCWYSNATRFVARRQSKHGKPLRLVVYNHRPIIYSVALCNYLKPHYRLHLLIQHFPVAEDGGGTEGNHGMDFIHKLEGGIIELLKRISTWELHHFCTTLDND